MSNEMDLQKANALAKFLNVSVDSISFKYGYFQVDIGGKYPIEYNVLDDYDACIACEEYIENSLWSFNPNFLLPFTCLPQDETGIKILKILQEKCEDSNDCIYNLVNSQGKMEKLIKAAIEADGRGHFLASYDSEENQIDGFFIYRQ